MLAFFVDPPLQLIFSAPPPKVPVLKDSYEKEDDYYYRNYEDEVDVADEGAIDYAAYDGTQDSMEPIYTALVSTDRGSVEVSGNEAALSAVLEQLDGTDRQETVLLQMSILADYMTAVVGLPRRRLPPGGLCSSLTTKSHSQAAWMSDWAFWHAALWMLIGICLTIYALFQLRESEADEDAAAAARASCPSRLSVCTQRAEDFWQGLHCPAPFVFASRGGGKRWALRPPTPHCRTSQADQLEKGAAPQAKLQQPAGRWPRLSCPFAKCSGLGRAPKHARSPSGAGVLEPLVPKELLSPASVHKSCQVGLVMPMCHLPTDRSDPSLSHCWLSFSRMTHRGLPRPWPWTYPWRSLLERS